MNKFSERGFLRRNNRRRVAGCPYDLKFEDMILAG